MSITLPAPTKAFPRAILHIDGDSFFASCEVASRPWLKGKPVITGLERGIASSMTYEAKARGISRAMSLREIRKLCPEAVILESDYETYSLYAVRMYAIVRRYAESVEEYSIDECFADLTGADERLRMPYEDIARSVKRDLDSELGMTFSVGLSVNKVLAKAASKWKKPDGFTVIRSGDIPAYTSKIPVDKIWGIGRSTSIDLSKLGVATAYDLACKDRDWVRERFSKPIQEIHLELNGASVYSVAPERNHEQGSVGKTRTFTPPSSDRSFVFAQLSRNIENACIKLRRQRLTARHISAFLKTQAFGYYGFEARLAQGSDMPEQFLSALRDGFNRTFRDGVMYRATGATLMAIGDASARTDDLFGDSVALDGARKIYAVIDRAARKFGRHAVFLGSSWKAEHRFGAPKRRKGVRGSREEHIRDAKSAMKEYRKIGIPFLGIVR